MCGRYRFRDVCRASRMALNFDPPVKVESTVIGFRLNELFSGVLPLLLTCYRTGFRLRAGWR